MVMLCVLRTLPKALTDAQLTPRISPQEKPHIGCNSPQSRTAPDTPTTRGKPQRKCNHPRPIARPPIRLEIFLRECLHLRRHPRRKLRSSTQPASPASISTSGGTAPATTRLATTPATPPAECSRGNPRPVGSTRIRAQTRTRNDQPSDFDAFQFAAKRACSRSVDSLLRAARLFDGWHHYGCGLCQRSANSDHAESTDHRYETTCR